jgi:hypothetical protein
VPSQKFFEGQLVRVNMDYHPYIKEGDTGIITLARPDKIDIAQDTGYSGDDFKIEWILVGLFNGKRVRVQENVLEEASLS